MNSWANSLLRIILDRSIEELIGAILLCLILSAAGAWLGLWLCRSRKDATARLTGVLLVVTLISMGVGATFIQNTLPDQQASHTPSTFSMMSGPPAFYQMVIVLDANGNGQVDSEELRKASVALGTAHLAFPDMVPDASDPDHPSVASGVSPEAPADTHDSPASLELPVPPTDAGPAPITP